MLDKKEAVRLERQRKEQLKLDKSLRIKGKQQESKLYKKNISSKLDVVKQSEKNRVIQNRNKILLIGVPNLSKKKTSPTVRFSSPRGDNSITYNRPNILFLKFKSLVEELNKIILNSNFADQASKQDTEALVSELTSELDNFSEESKSCTCYQELEKYRISCLDLSLLIEYTQKSIVKEKQNVIKK